MKYFIVAGELSGDNHAAALVREIQVRDNSASIIGWGGDAMSSAGVKVIQHIRGLNSMGVWEVTSGLLRMKRLLRECTDDIKRFKPDVVVLVDYGGFNLRLARVLSGGNTKVAYYIPPKVWAWGRSRIKGIERYTDQILLILPFEQDFYHQHGASGVYVGNPVVEQVEQYKLRSSVLPKRGLGGVVVLPGSRTQEIQRILPIIAELATKDSRISFVVSKVSTVDWSHYEILQNICNVEVSTDQIYDLIQGAQATIVTSGTVTLEVALLNVPQVVIYKTSWLTYLIAKVLVKVPFISLVNLIARRAVVTELIQEQLTLENLHRELNSLLGDEEKQKKISEGYSEIKNILTEKSASKNAAEMVYTLGRS